MYFEAPDLDDHEIAVLAKVGETNAGLRLRLLESPPWADSFARIQFARSVQWSCGIDGLVVPLDDAMALSVGELPIDTGEDPGLSVKAYRDALFYIGQLCADGYVDVTEQLLKSIHFILSNHEKSARAGRWRVGPSVVIDEAGNVTYSGPDASEVPSLVHDVVGASPLTNGSPALIRGAMAHLNVAMIRPFEKGNGRVARCFQSLVYARQSALAPTFGSIDEYLGRNVRAYFDALAAQREDSKRKANDVRPWVRFMLTAHLRQSQSLKRRVSESDQVWQRLEKLISSRGLPERSIVALYDASLDLRVRSATYRAALNDAVNDETTEATASRDLRQLSEAGLLEAKGEKRGRHYVATMEVQDIRRSVVDERKKKERADPFSKR